MHSLIITKHKIALPFSGKRTTRMYLIRPTFAWRWPSYSTSP